MLATQVTDKAYKGWQASLALQFCHTPEKTVLHSARHVGPLTVQRPFYPENETCHLYLLHPPGGIVGGDELEISVRLEAKSHALITMPGASKFYRSNGALARLNQHFFINENAVLEWLPQDTIFFPGANARLRSVFHLHPSGTLLAWELFCLGRPVINETFSHGTLESRLEVWLEDQPLLIERQHLTDGNLTPVAHQPWIGTLLCYPASDALLEGVRERLTPLENYAGATLTDGLLSVRFLASDNLICQRVMRDIWHYLRPHVIAKTPHAPRIWQT
ncbi:urease accessory protein UreD [Lelliottia sp. CFBP8978]|jgi:urease accessory protein|uniref:urease accessory protein UreD n=1 Tax=Lelliottia sp. CFBP8978 TaxID=3096522 RepID=UPI002A6B8B33|nr:urease accessory protein UreD [Lelliottia sp. CFBP8978]MDY1039169.1 urease accessory protein UreD [Lelliottia sp. CFBP8978]